MPLRFFNKIAANLVYGKYIKIQINYYHKKAQNNLEDLTITNKDDLNDFANLLLKREV